MHNARDEWRGQAFGTGTMLFEGSPHSHLNSIVTRRERPRPLDLVVGPLLLDRSDVVAFLA